MGDKRAQVTIAVATRGNDIYYGTMFFVIASLMAIPRCRLITSVSPISAARGQEENFKIARELGTEWIYLCDSDVAPAEGTIQRLMARGKDICVSPVPMYLPLEDDIHYNASREPTLRERTVKRGQGLERIWSSSFASVLLRASILDEFVKRGEPYVEWSPVLPDWCRGLSTDSIFYLKTRMMGFEAWIDWDIEPAVHHRYVTMNLGFMETFIERVKADK